MSAFVAGGGNFVPLGQTAGAFATTPVLVNFAVAGDNVIAVPLPPGYTQFRPSLLNISQASAALTGANFGVFTGAGATGFTLINAGTAATPTNNTPNTSGNYQASTAFTVTASAQAVTPGTGSVLYFRVGSTAAATAMVSFIYFPLP